MFFAVRNNAVVGYDLELVAFESKKRRDKMVKATDFRTVSAKDAANHRKAATCRKYPETIFREDGRMSGVVLFCNNGEFAQVAR